MNAEVETLGTALPKEMARVRDEVMPAYIKVGPAGSFALAMMCADLNTAAKALAEGDIPLMIISLNALKGYSL